MSESIPILCGSIASRPSALGVKMHNAAYEATGVPYTYVAFGTENTKDAVRAMRYLGIRGMGVSMPHKIRIMELLDEIGETAVKIGAVNTVVNNHGRLIGYNTDWIGAMQSLEEETNLDGKQVVVVGAGGAARAIVYGLVKSNSQVTLYNRTHQRGIDLAKDFGVQFGGGLENLTSIRHYDVLVNATSVGFGSPEESVIPASILAAGSIVLDVVFIPPESRLIRDARASGCTTISGVRMLVHQALHQFKLYTGKDAPFSVMENALLNAL